MAGQIQLEEYNQNKLYNHYKDKVIDGVKKLFVKDHYNIETNISEKRNLKNYLYKELFASKECEVQDFIDKSIRGVLGDETVDIVDLKSMQYKYRDINNYYYSAANYERVEW